MQIRVYPQGEASLLVPPVVVCLVECNTTVAATCIST